MLTGSIPKLLQEAGRVKEALEKIGDGLPAGASVTELEAKITALDTAVSELDALNAERTRLVNMKREQAQLLSDYIVQIRLAVKVAYGPDSSEYEMTGGTRASQRKKRVRKVKVEE